MTTGGGGAEKDLQTQRADRRGSNRETSRALKKKGGRSG